MMSSTSYDKSGRPIGDAMPNTASTLITGQSRSIPYQTNLQNTRGPRRHQSQASAQLTANFAPANSTITSNTIAESNKIKRTYVHRDRTRMKCTRCMLNKRGCDGRQPQCDSCRKSNQKCEWVGAGVTRKDLENQIAEGTITRPMKRRKGLTQHASDDQISDGATEQGEASHYLLPTQAVNNRREAQDGITPVPLEWEEYLLDNQRGMADTDEEEGHVEDDEPGSVFDRTTKLYEDYELAEGSIADQWAREANAGLQLNWRDDPTALSHYSHGDCGGLGFMSTMMTKLGIKPSNQIYQSHQPPASRPTQRIPTQDWEHAGTVPFGRGAGAEIWWGQRVEGEMAASQADTSLEPQPDINWDEWIHPEAW